MYTAKRPRSKAKADLSKDLNEACSATKKAQRTGHKEPSAKRFVPTPAAVMTVTPLVFVLTMLSVMGYWKQLPNLPETAKAFVDVQQVTQGFAPPPPTLPRKVPVHVKGPVDLACRAVKVAWLLETKRADLTGEEVSDESLNTFYRRGRQWFALHASQPEMHASFHELLLTRATQIKSYVNASQRRSFEEQLDQGIKQPRVEGMTPQAVRTKIRNEKLKNATRLQPPFPAAVQAGGPIKISTLR
eukprot:scaffold49624_cov105-Phaeocystis_antarctica.AAC.1